MVGHKLGEFAPTRTFRGHVTKEKATGVGVPAAPAEGASMTNVHAKARYVGMSAQKVRLVVDLVRGRPADDALTMLKFLPNSAAGPISKVLRTAIANAEENFGLSRDDLVVAEAFADEGPTRKWRRFGARGRISRFCGAHRISPSSSRNGKERRRNGSQSSSDRFRPRHHKGLGSALVCPQGQIRRAASAGLHHPPHHRARSHPLGHCPGGY